MKKDYLDGGSMADTADLIVLGSYYGTGNKGTLAYVRELLHIVLQGIGVHNSSVLL